MNFKDGEKYDIMLLHIEKSTPKLMKMFSATAPFQMNIEGILSLPSTLCVFAAPHGVYQKMSSVSWDTAVEIIKKVEVDIKSISFKNLVN